MSPSYFDWNHGQTFLLPPSPHDWLPEGHLARFVADLVQHLDITELVMAIEADREARGAPMYPPRLMLGLLIYGYMTGTTSSRRIEQKCHEDVGYRFLCGNLLPGHRTIARFRRQHLGFLPRLFEQSVLLCVDAGLVDLEFVSVDGTRLLANASKRKAMSYGRMRQEEERLRQKIAELLDDAEAVDAKEDRELGDDGLMPQVRDELRHAATRRAFIVEQMKRMEEEAKQSRAAVLRDQAAGNEERAETEPDPVEAKRKRTNAARQRKEADDIDDEPPPPAPTDLPRARRTTNKGRPKPGTQQNFTDPDSRIMMHDGAFVQGFNAQAAVDGKTKVIVAQGVGNCVPDTYYLVPMLHRVAEVMGRLPQTVAADAGFWCPSNAVDLERLGVDAYIAVSRTPHGLPPPGIDPKGLPPPADEYEAMQRKVGTEQGREMMLKRRTGVEPVFGNIKEPRGFRRTSLRGLERVRGEWSLVTAVHNLLKLFNYGSWRPQVA